MDKTFKVVITDMNFPTDEPERTVFGEIGAKVERYQCRTENEIIEIAKGADALLVQWAPVTKRVIMNLDKARAIGRYGVGVDNIDLKTATEKGIQVVNVIYDITDVADHTVTLLLALNRKIHLIYDATRHMRWDWREYHPIGRLEGSTAGIIGFGRVGREVASRLNAFGMRLLGYDPYVPEAIFTSLSVRKVELPELLKVSDFVTLNSALSSENLHMIDEPQLRLMKKTAYLVNTSRGALVNESALSKALEQQWIAGAALDVLEHEPPRQDNPLLKLDNVILTPHMAWYSASAVGEIQTKCAEDVARILVGKEAINLVNKDVLSKLRKR